MELSRLTKSCNKSSSDWEVLSTDKYNQIINDVKKAKRKSCQLPADNLLLLRYDVVIENNVEKLVKPAQFNRFKYYVHVDELYDIVYRMHVETDHAGLSQVYKSLQLKYINIPLKYVRYCISKCHVCSSQNKSTIELADIKNDEQLINVAQWNNSKLNHSKSRVYYPFKKVEFVDLIDDNDDSIAVTVNSIHGTDSDNPSVNVSATTAAVAIISSSTTTTTTSCNNFVKNEEKEVQENMIMETSNINNEYDSDVISCSSSAPSPAPSEVVNPETIPDERYSLSNSVLKEPMLLNESPVTIDLVKEEIECEEDNIKMEDRKEICLYWSRHNSNMKSNLCNFLDEELYVDVTLICENASLNCHKIILSANSPYFRKLFAENPCQQQVVLKDVSLWELKMLIKFIYKGGIRVPQSKLESLLRAAEILKIKGFADSVPRKNKNQQNKILFYNKKMNGVANCNEGENSQLPAMVEKLNRSSISCNEFANESETTETLPVAKADSSNSNISSQNSVSVPNPYAVLSQTYVPVVNQSSLINHSHPQNVIPVNQTSYRIPSFPPIPCAPSSISQVFYRVPLTQMPYSSFPVYQMPSSCKPLPKVSDIPTSFTETQRFLPKNTISISCSSSTQTASQEDDGFDNEKEVAINKRYLNDDRNNQIVNNSAKKPKICSSNNNKLKEKSSATVINKNDSNKIKKRKRKNKNDSVSKKINNFIRTKRTPRKKKVIARKATKSIPETMKIRQSARLKSRKTTR